MYVCVCCVWGVSGCVYIWYVCDICMCVCCVYVCSDGVCVCMVCVLGVRVCHSGKMAVKEHHSPLPP